MSASSGLGVFPCGGSDAELITGQLLPCLQHGWFLAVLVAMGCPHPACVPRETQGWGRMFVALLGEPGICFSWGFAGLAHEPCVHHLCSSAPARQGSEMPHVRGSWEKDFECWEDLSPHGSTGVGFWQSLSVQSTGWWKLRGAAGSPARLRASTASPHTPQGCPHPLGVVGRGSARPSPGYQRRFNRGAATVLPILRAHASWN